MRSPKDYRELAELYAALSRQMSDAVAAKHFRIASDQCTASAERMESHGPDASSSTID
jgi:hypothetical protein